MTGLTKSYHADAGQTGYEKDRRHARVPGWPRTRLQTQEAPSEKPQRHEDHRDSRPAISVLLASLWFFAIARSSRGGCSGSCRFVASFLVCAVADEFDFGDA